MSAYGPFYTEEQIWDIAAFLEHIKNLPPGVLERIQSKAAKDAGDPQQAVALYKASVAINPFSILWCPRANKRAIVTVMMNSSMAFSLRNDPMIS